MARTLHSMSRRKQGALLALCVGALVAPTHALSGVTIVSYMALAIMLGSAFFFYFGIYAPRNGFLLVGNMLCVAANVVFVMMLVDQQGNDTWIVAFAAMALANTYSTLVVLKKFKEEGCGDDEDSDAEDSEAEAAAEIERIRKVANENMRVMDKGTRKTQARQRRAQRAKATARHN